jgi:hypothetical protein
MQIKFNYTEGGEFTINNTPYVGYFNVDDRGNAYSGKYQTIQSIELNSINEYSADYHKTDIFKDRYAFDAIALPYSLDEILIQPNEIVSFDVLNKKMEYLHYNLIYLYSQMFMGSTDIPLDNDIDTFCNYIGSSAFDWEIRTKNNRIFGFKPFSENPHLSAYKEFDNIKRFVPITFNDKSGVSILAISNTHLMALTSRIGTDGNLYDPAFTIYRNVIDNNTEETCKNLEDITFDGRYAYISDSKINGGGQVFKYDVSSYYTNDKVFENKVYLIDPIGGLGGIDSKNKFNGCSILGSKPDELWVYDSGNNIIKVYNSNFIWKKNIKIPSIRKYSILDIRYRKLNNHMYVLYRDEYDLKPENYDLNDVKFGFFEYDENYTLIKTVVFDDVLINDTETRLDVQFNRMALSEQDSNVFYVITNNNAFKKFFSKPEKTFAVFDREKLYPDDYFIWDEKYMLDKKWDELADYEIWNYSDFFTDSVEVRDIYINPTEENAEEVYFIGNSYITKLKEKTEYVSLLRHENLPYYNYDQVKFEKTEYAQSFTFNKEFYKLFANIIQFKNNLKGRFYAEYNKYSDLVYRDYIYLIDEEINTLDIELEYNSFINNNEMVEPNVINRIIKKIYDFELKLLKLSDVKLKNLKTYVDLKNAINIYPID